MLVVTHSITRYCAVANQLIIRPTTTAVGLPSLCFPVLGGGVVSLVRVGNAVLGSIRIQLVRKKYMLNGVLNLDRVLYCKNVD